MIEENNIEEQLKLLSEEQIQQALNLLQKNNLLVLYLVVLILPYYISLTQIIWVA